jgi:perosamine synthetase
VTRATSRLAIDGGDPVRTQPLPYGRQWVDDDDVEAVTSALRSDWLTTGPRVAEFERAFADVVGAPHAVAVNSGTAALQAALDAVGIGPGDEVVVPALTFAATASTVLMQGARPVFADVDVHTLLLTPATLEPVVSSATRAVVAVDYAGQPCDYDALRAICAPRNLHLLSDACHALGAHERGRPAGALADLTSFSLHPVKHVTTGEGGVVATANAEWAERMRRFRNHGISVDHRQRSALGDWRYEIASLGYNYRLTDVQCALGLSQLSRLAGFLTRRREIAARYDRAFAAIPAVAPLERRPEVEHAYHLYVVRVDKDRRKVFDALRAEGIGVNVHYEPIHLHPLFRTRCGTGPGMCPIAEREYERILTLPLFPAMRDDDVDDVITAVEKVMTHLR